MMLAIYLGITACRKDIIVPAQISNPSKLELVWQRPLSLDTMKTWASILDVRANKLLYKITTPRDPWPLQLCDSEAGAPIWRLNGNRSPCADFSTSDLFVSNNMVIAEDDGDVYAIDYTSGQPSWNVVCAGWTLGSTQIGDYFYTIQTTGYGFHVSSTSLVRTHIQSTFSGWDTLYTRYAVPDSFPIINFPVLWVNPRGDSILLFDEAQAHIGAYGGKSYLTALHLKTRKILWQYPDFKGFYNKPPLVNGDRLYVSGNSMFCFDLNAGTLLWEKYFPNSAGTSILAHQNYLIVESGEIGLLGLDKFTGEVIWNNKDFIWFTHQLMVSNGIIFFISGRNMLCAVNAESGATIWEERSPNYINPKTADAIFHGPRMAIDPQRRLLYMTDNYYLMCIKMPEL